MWRTSKIILPKKLKEPTNGNVILYLRKESVRNALKTMFLQLGDATRKSITATFKFHLSARAVPSAIHSTLEDAKNLLKRASLSQSESSSGRKLLWMLSIVRSMLAI